VFSPKDHDHEREDAGEEHRTLQAAAVAAGLASPTPPRPPASPARSGLSPAAGNGGLISPAYERLLADWPHRGTARLFECPTWVLLWI
jgi:hypothetical protein